jgi:cytochrome c553
MSEKRFRSLIYLIPLAALLLASSLATSSDAAKSVSYRESIEPIFKSECSGCHNKASASGGFSLETPELLRKGGVKFGEKVIIPGKPAQSILVGYLRGTHQPRMPIGLPPLPENKIRIIEDWIAQGAKVDEVKLGWPYAPPAPVTPPALPRTGLTDFTKKWARNDVDRFILAKLNANGLQPAPSASKGVLLRRVYLDVVGTPPTPEEADAFLLDKSPDAYEKLVNRLLDDPRYGERWARHWLDLVRYAETHGFEADNIRPRAWRYRDYVIRALNSDKPYDRFLKEQIAGDELYPQDSDAWIATGFLRLGAYDELATDPPQRRQDILNDATDTLSSAVLGMTVGCARCHDHKYDRISQRDYYRLQAFFVNTKWVDQKLPVEVDAASLIQKRNTLKDQTQKLNLAIDQIRSDVRKALGKNDADDDAIDKWLQDASRKDKKAEWDRLRGEEGDTQRQLRPIEATAETVTDTGKEVPSHHVLLRGNLATPGDPVQPGFIAALSEGREKDAVITAFPDKPTSGARTALANWVASPKNPMTARVIVNRLWQHHFGNGLVSTASDFGRNGEKPRYPGLLDWMAQELPRHGWSLKAMHRLILNSATYRQIVAVNPKAEKLDPQNRLFWRQNRQRLEAEAIRDGMLAVSGGLNDQRGGPGIYPAVSDEVLATGSTHKWGSSPEDQQRRRTIYVFQRRSLPLPMVEVFDGPDMVNSCTRRNATTIAPQALTMFNGDFGWSEARRFAERLATEGNSDSRIEKAYRLALVRRPTPEEKKQVAAFLEKKKTLHLREGMTDPKKVEFTAWTEFCHVLFNTNEFVYVD